MGRRFEFGQNSQKVKESFKDWVVLRVPQHDKQTNKSNCLPEVLEGYNGDDKKVVREPKDPQQFAELLQDPTGYLYRQNFLSHQRLFYEEFVA